MSKPTHPLLALVDDCKKNLKASLTKHIDDTVENKFGQLMNLISEKIASGEFDLADVNVQVSTQANTNQVNSSNQQSPSNTFESLNFTISPLLKQECLDTSSATINFNCIDAPNDDDNDESNNVESISSLNQDQTSQIPSDEEDGESYQIDPLHAQVNASAFVQPLPANHQNDLSNASISPSTMNNSDEDLSSDQFTCLLAPRQANHIATSPAIKQECPEDSPTTLPIIYNQIVDSNDAPNDVATDQSNNVGISLNDVQNEQALIDDVNEEYDDDEYADEEGEYMSDCGDCEGCLDQTRGMVGENDNADNAETGLDTENGLGEDDIENQSDASSESNLTGRVNPDEVIDDSNQSIGNENVLSLIGESEQQIRSVRKSTRQKNKTDQSSQAAIELNQQSNPSTSRLRSSSRKRTQTKWFGDNRSNEQDKPRRMTQSTSKAVNKGAHQDVGEIQPKEDNTKLLIVALKVNCIEPDCKSILNSREEWNEHLSTCHGQTVYKRLKGNVRHNQQNGQTEYPCTECETVKESRMSLYKHWKSYHLPGKYQCSVCAFEANIWCKVHNHYRSKHGSSKFECTHEGCSKVYKTKHDLKQHKQSHSGKKPYKCNFEECQSSFCQHASAIRHVRTRHFKLPETVREQEEQNIIDVRDPRDYVVQSS